MGNLCQANINDPTIYQNRDKPISTIMGML